MYCVHLKKTWFVLRGDFFELPSDVVTDLRLTIDDGLLSISDSSSTQIIDQNITKTVATCVTLQFSLPESSSLSGNPPSLRADAIRSTEPTHIRYKNDIIYGFLPFVILTKTPLRGIPLYFPSRILTFIYFYINI
jgi:hypothetical protein